MIRSLLVDLDDTLLENDVSRFLPAYLGLLARDLSRLGRPDVVMAAIQHGTQAMLNNVDPARTLLDAFLSGFAEVAGVDPDRTAEAIHRFYAETYPSLSSLTRPKDGSRELLRGALAKGWTIAVATNPLMTRAAVNQRLAWAGVPAETFPYAVVTTAEHFHFAKPRSAFYGEVLARLGCLPDEAAMVGNDLQEDLHPAASLGMRAFHLTSSPPGTFPGGDLGKALEWLEEADGTPAPAGDLPESLIARLEGQLAGLLGSLTPIRAGRLGPAEPPGTLSPLEVIAHLRDVDREINLPRLERILQEDDPFLSAVDTDQWIQERNYRQEEPTEAIAGLVAARKAVLARLRSLPKEAWNRTARHALLGPITLSEWIAVLTEHDLRHIGHVAVGAGTATLQGRD